MAEPEPSATGDAPEKEDSAAAPAEGAAPATLDVEPSPPPPANDNPLPQKSAEPAPAKKKPLKLKLFEKGVAVAGFGDILKAWRSPGNRLRNVLKSIGTKAADMVAGRIVSSTFRLVAITWVAGMIGGVSTFGGLALLAVATGAASGIYSYGKDYVQARFLGPKDKRKETKLVDRARAKSAGISFLSGTATGALGAYLAKTGILQNALGAVKNVLTSGGGMLSRAYNGAAESLPKLPVTAQFQSATAVPAPPAPNPLKTPDFAPK
ncbi:MAG TPA: hypothetical protein VEF76_14145 [Patescibacteria group bacterium]|nr:hypothetical protein [Patescibacteria group bacterium]